MADIRDNYQRDYTGMDTDELDFPANTSTIGLVESGWLDYGRIYPTGDVDWFKVNLTAGEYYKFQIEAGTINGLFDPNLAVYNASSQLLATATIGQGFQSKWVELTPNTSGSYYLAASGSSELYGSYNLYILNGTTTATSTENTGVSPTLVTPSTITLSDTSADDTYTKTTGTLNGTDGDGDKLTYGVEGGKSGVKAGTYGTLKVNSSSGAYTYTPNDKTIEALSADANESFTITVKDKTNTTTAELVINLTGAIDIRTGTEANDNLTGTEGIDSLAGDSGVDNLKGLGGNDILDGGDGVDKLIGGAGDDTYYINDYKPNTTKVADTVTEKANEGVDTVISSINYTLTANVEKLTLTGLADITGTGEKGNNTITGNSGNNLLKGMDGADTLNGGAGNDTFVFDTKLNATTNIDTISDFTSGDVLSLSAKVFAKLKDDTNLSDNIYIQTIVGISTQDEDDYLFFDLETGHLSYDADGSGIKAAVQFATLTGVTSLTASDLHIV